MEEAYEFLKETAPTYYLATVEDGNPRVRPFGTIDLYEGRLYIQTGKNKKVYQQILDHPEVELCACAGPKWLRATGELVPDDSVKAKKHMLDNYPALRGMYDENDDNTIVLYFKNATATFESLADGSKRTIGWEGISRHFIQFNKS